MPFSVRTVPLPARPATLQAGILKVAAFEGFAPFVWKENGGAQGRDITFLRLFAAVHRLEMEVEFFPFDQLWEVPARGKADVAASGLSLSASSRPGGGRWTLPYSSVRRALLIREEDLGRIRGMNDLRRQAVVAGSLAHAHARKTLPASAELTFCATLESGIAALLNGRTDAVGTGDISARHHLSRHPGLAAVDVHGARKPEQISFAARAAGLLPQMLNAFIVSHGHLY